MQYMTMDKKSLPTFVITDKKNKNFFDIEAKPAPGVAPKIYLSQIFSSIYNAQLSDEINYFQTRFYENITQTCICFSSNSK